MEFLLGIFTFIIAWPILASIAFGTFILFLLVNDHELLSTFIVIGTTVLGILIFQKTNQSPSWSDIVYWVGIYFAIGVAFTLPKWYLWSRKMGKLFNDLKKTKDTLFEKDKLRHIDNYCYGRLDYNEQTLYRNRSTEDITAIKLKIDSYLPEANKEWLLKQDSLLCDHWNYKYSKGFMLVKQSESDPTKVEVNFDKSSLVVYLTLWIINWPFYMALLLLEDLIIEIITQFSNLVDKLFRSIVTNEFNQS